LNMSVRHISNFTLCATGPNFSFSNSSTGCVELTLRCNLDLGAIHFMSALEKGCTILWTLWCAALAPAALLAAAASHTDTR
jgi:hypothetical protein